MTGAGLSLTDREKAILDLVVAERLGVAACQQLTWTEMREKLKHVYADLSQNPAYLWRTNDQGNNRCLVTSSRLYSFFRDGVLLPSELLRLQGPRRSLHIPSNVPCNSVKALAGEGFCLPCFASVLWAAYLTKGAVRFVFLAATSPCGQLDMGKGVGKQGGRQGKSKGGKASQVTAMVKVPVKKDGAGTKAAAAGLPVRAAVHASHSRHFFSPTYPPAEPFVKKQGIPVGPGDIWCITTGKRMMPHVDFELLCQMLKKDPELKARFMKARLHVADPENNPLPVLTPSAEVFSSDKCGHMVYVKAALLSDTELVNHTGRTGLQLGLKQHSVDLRQGANQPTKLFPVSLQGLPQEFKDSCPRVKIYFDQVSSENREIWVTPETQLNIQQPADLQRHLQARSSDARPKLQGSLKTLSELVEQGNRMESEVLATTAAAMATEPDDGDEQPEEPADPSHQAAEALLETFHQGNWTATKKTRKRKDVEPATSVATSVVEGPEGSEKASTKRGKTKAGLKELSLDSLDESMRKVAKQHFANNPDRNVSVNCLSNLVLVMFADDGTDHSQGHTLSGVGVAKKSCFLVRPVANTRFRSVDF
ncbi:unnamed protein product [Symbiodinium sp. CCMP2456]|nr:unnamed protein product [Symbiodinium sp. CCMP2456]